MAARALAHIGAPFRFKGRSAASGFDCVGLVGDAISLSGATTALPLDYTLSGDHAARISLHFRDLGWRSLPCKSACRSADILMLRTAPRQVHLGIVVDGGLVHAHAGLGRVVLTPLPSPWPVCGHWRYFGE